MLKISSLIVLSTSVAFVSAQVGAEPLGSFQGELVYKGIAGQERVVETVTPFAFEDPNGKLWSVPSGTRVDGASIPQAFWSVIGGPFTGKYREASVIHDYYCDTKTETWQDTHRVFYDGMRANGVDAVTANTMYAAVYWGGPRWVRVDGGNGTIYVAGQPRPLDKTPVDIAKLAAKPGISVNEIARTIDAVLSVEATPAQRQLLEGQSDCSLVVEPMEKDASAFAICELDRDSQKLLAARNLKILIDDVDTLLTANTSLLLPKIDAYIADPSKDRWQLVQAASKKVNRLVSLTLVSVAQAEKGLAQSAQSLDAAARDADLSKKSVERVKKIGATRGLMLERTMAADAPKRSEMEQWKAVYVQLLSRLKDELPTLKAALK